MSRTKFHTCEVCCRLYRSGMSTFCRHPSGSLKKTDINSSCQHWEPRDETVRENMERLGVRGKA